MITKKNVLIVSSLLVLILICAGIFYFVKIKNNPSTGTEENLVKESERYGDLLTRNEYFNQGVQAAINGNYQESIRLFDQAKTITVRPGDLSVINFNIADSLFNFDRASGTVAFIDFAKDEASNKQRTRALAMLQVYLGYRKYNDESVLKIILDSYGITSTKYDEFVTEYMQKIYDVYPVAYAGLGLVRYDLKYLSEQEARQKYTDILPKVQEDLNLMKENSGETLVYTSTLLLKARTLESAYLRYNLATLENVERSYEEVIEVDQQKNDIVNQQYGLLAYANFESSVKNYTKAESLLSVILTKGLQAPLKEALPKTNISNYYSLKDLIGKTSNQSIKDFVNYIGSDIK